MGTPVTKAEIAKLQQALADPPWELYRDAIDGDYGPNTHAALTSFCAVHKFAAPVYDTPVYDTTVTPARVVVPLDALYELGIRDRPTTIAASANGLLAKLALPFILKALKDTPAMNFLYGMKTYILGTVLIVLGALNFLGWQVPGLPPPDPATSWPTILAGIGLITGRAGARADATLAASNIDPKTKTTVG